MKDNNFLYYSIRIDPKTGKEIKGRYLWTPLEDNLQINLSEEERIYIPDATEAIKQPPLSMDYKDRKLKAATNKEPSKEKIDSLSNKSLVAGSIVANAAYQYYDGCICGCIADNNCAHYVSNAFILSGMTELLSSNLITARCILIPCSNNAKRPIRAYDMLQWFIKKTNETGGSFYSGNAPRGSGWWATYQEKPGAKHVVIIDCDNWDYYGTNDYPDWPIQYNYKF